MKELTIEEKAKAYDEAIKAAREWSETKNGYYTPKELCEEIFPELKESEDERVEKAMHEAGYEWSEETHQLKKIEQKPAWCPSKKQLEALKDLLDYNIGVFDYQKFMEVNSLYDNLTRK